ncbi:2-hydroxy-3-keto-5-methylthiopentenyl-1-phosphate phosphatase [Metabacillus sp. KIGAM252]|uniref:2-hydroxy-3-keto-5-methylthiopentenyl-1-phosphate phosphatase n=1 Tax=Metabacillus flavus TaxID=2823519 RepID=A0ABS5LDD1_9BACI|nr:2-hydroxy-3-keto-5-methylthiopentenyl-1-phosphate phosphatase [Metabacillus flavus]MBS2968553.1 2-hydroxy-3-keto-5-methylthiopentenyl-1-phosphate phosphatase [Metabacillus flavus]
MKPVIFCDFDGTITINDNIIEIMKQFAPPEWEELKNQVLNRTISVKEGVGKMFSLLPSSKREEITSYLLDQAEIREGFTEFAAYAKEQNIELYIVSGGIDFFVHPLLNGQIEQQKIFCNEADFQGEQILIHWPHPCDADSGCEMECGCCKPSIIRGIASTDQEIIVIGDSVTDLEAAKMADFVIARDYLLDKVKEQHLSFEPFETFHDVVSILEKRRVSV